MCFKKNRKKPTKISENIKIVSLEKFLLHLSGMGESCDYEIATDGESANLSFYVYRCQDGGYGRVLDTSVKCELSGLIDKLNEVKLASWDGFFGEHPKNVLNGVMFDLKAVVNGEKSIQAEGSENFPTHYHDLVRWLNECLRG